MVVPARPNRTNLLLLAAAPLVELPVVTVVATALPEAAAESVFGSPGTQVALIAALCATLVGVVLAWSATPPSLGAQWVVGGSLCVLAGVAAVPMVGFLVSGRWFGPGILLAHCVVFMFLIAKQVARGAPSARASAGRR